MKIGLRIFLGYFLIVGLAGFFVMRVFVEEVKPGVRQAMEDTLVDTSNALALLAAHDLQAGDLQHGQFAASVDALARRDVDAKIWNYHKRHADYRIYVTDAKGIVVYDSSHRDVGKDFSRWNDVYLTLRGKYGARSTRSDPNDDASSVMHVAAPVRDAAGRIIGSLTVAKPNGRIQPFIENSRQAILRKGWWLLGLSFLIGVLVTAWLSRSLAKLGTYAKAVTSGERVPPPDLGRNEIGDLGRALATMRDKLDGKQYVEQYTQTLAHEMKSPLAAIRAATEVLESDPPEAERLRFLGHVSTQSERLSAMIDKVLALAAVEYRQSLDRPESVDLAAVLAKAVDDLAPRLEQRQLRVELDAQRPATLRGNAFLLGQAVTNLLENALEFSPPGSSIEAKLQREGERWRLSIADRGPGVPEFALGRVFERFYSLPRPGGARSSGIGLSFVREVAALHGGDVRLDNREGGGAVAELELPAG
jgi:two-component system sensor histidine kinase CreC